MQTFRKTRPDAPAGFFEVEAAGLRWLAATETVRVPRVLAVGPGFIELERVARGVPTEAAALAFGRALAALHDAGAPAFGAPPEGWSGDGYVGDAPLPLRTEATWGRFYARWRIEPYLAAASLTTQDAATIAALCDRLEAGDFDDGAPPARLHGDLWSGNTLFTPDGVVLIDPAAHGGHRLTDLAMLSLFGSSELRVILDAYAAASTHLPEDWRSLIPLHQVHPLLVHAALFGGDYGARAAAAAQRALALR
nr:phosphotransferase [Propionibacterium sp.]